MRKKLAKAVRSEFDRELGRRLPQFSREQEAPYEGGHRLYRWQPSGGLTFFLLLLLDHKGDRFTVEVAWSSDGQWPADHLWASPDDPPEQGALRFRLPRLWQPFGVDPWWELVSDPDVFAPMDEWLAEPPAVDEVLPKVPALVEDAVGRIQSEGMAYFRRIGAGGDESR